MKIAITGAQGTVGKQVVQVCADNGHHTVQIDRVEGKLDVPNTECRVADVTDYTETLAAFKGCDALIHLAAIPNPVNREDHVVHSNNVNAAFNGFRAAAEVGIKKICYASSVNAIGLGYANQPLDHFDYFPLDEEARGNPTDSYALAKAETELQAKAFVNWFPGTKIACMRFHEVLPRKDVAQEHSEEWHETGVKQLWGWVHPAATARACVLAVEKADNFEGMEVFNIHAPTTAQDTPSKELAKKYFPETKLKEGWGEKNESFWTYDKAERILGWKHYETE